MEERPSQDHHFPCAARYLACAHPILSSISTTARMQAASGHPGPHAALLRPWRAEVEQRRSSCRDLTLRHIGVGHDANGKPLLEFSGRALEFVREKGITTVHVSLADEEDNAVAFVTLETA